MVVSDASWGQLTEARALDRSPPLVAADLAGLPVGAGSLGGIVGFYCLIYGPAEHLDPVFADWHRALEPGGVAAIAVHAGHGEIHADRWEGRSVDMTVVLRDPDDVARRLRRSGFVVHEQAVRPPYTDENTDRCYIVATRGSR
jgi:SAM-dependent methyltransferase